MGLLSLFSLLALFAACQSHETLHTGINFVGLPESFNAAEAWPQCASLINNVRDQGACLYNWATAVASTTSDLTCIRCNGVVAPYLSDEDLLTCCSDCGDCEHGGSLDRAFNYWISEGLVTGGPYNSKQGCQPYAIPPSNQQLDDASPNCTATCGPWFPYSYSADKHKGSVYGTISGHSQMQAAIYTYGPIVVTNFQVYDDFKTYKTGVYHHISGNLLGVTAVKVIGWGTDDVPYWLAVNSLGTNWGMNGLFKIKRGTNECNFETSAIQALASLDACFQAGQSTTPGSSPAVPTTRPHSSANRLSAMIVILPVAMLMTWLKF